MATKIRLQRRGRKHYAFYSIVVADSRAPRDGKFVEKIGTYNPNTDPATVELNFERALYWVNTGATPTDTARSILSREGVYLMKHLQGGVKKGAFDEAAAQAKFDAWKAEKTNALKQAHNDSVKIKRHCILCKNISAGFNNSEAYRAVRLELKNELEEIRGNR